MPPALLNYQPGEMRKPVVLDRVRQQPSGQIGGRTRTEGPKPETVLKFSRMAPSVPLRGEIVLDRLGKSVNLLGDEQEKRPWRPLARLQRTARIAQIAKHEGVAEAIMIATNPFGAATRSTICNGAKRKSTYLRYHQMCCPDFAALSALWVSSKNLSVQSPS